MWVFRVCYVRIFGVCHVRTFSLRYGRFLVWDTPGRLASVIITCGAMCSAGPVCATTMATADPKRIVQIMTKWLSLERIVR